MKKLILLLTPIIFIAPTLNAIWNPFEARWSYDRNRREVFRAPILDVIDHYYIYEVSLISLGSYGTNVYYNRKLYPPAGWKSHLFTPFKDFYHGITATGSSIKNISKRAASNTVAGIKNAGSFCYKHKGKIGAACAIGGLIAGGLWASQEYFCDICYENKYRPYFTTLSCDHRYCTKCLNRQVEVGLNSKSTNSLKCPDPECRRPFTNTTIRKIVGFFSGKRRQCQELADQKYLISLPNSQHCPTPNCRYIMKDKGNQPHTVQCPDCQAQYCSHCTLPHAENVSCRQAKDQQVSEADKASKKLVQSISTRCPQCGTNIQKDGGCNHMTCGKCEHHFCWLCLAPRPSYHGHVCNPIGLLQRPGIALTTTYL